VKAKKTLNNFSKKIIVKICTVGKPTVFFLVLILFMLNNKRLFFLRAKRTKNLGAFRIRPKPLTGRGGVLCRFIGVWWRVAPAPTRFTVWLQNGNN
jgi:hypothetical protein